MVWDRHSAAPWMVLSSRFHSPIGTQDREQVSNLPGLLAFSSNPGLSHGTMRLSIWAFSSQFQPVNPHNPFLFHFWSGRPPPPPLPHHPDAIAQDFFHILQPHLPFVASPKAGCLRRDSFLPLLLDIQTGGQRAWTEIARGEGAKRTVR